MVRHRIPVTLEEALEHLNETTYKIIAGGTDLMVQNRAWSELPPKFDAPLLFCFNLEALKYVKEENAFIKIGSMTDLETLLHHPLTPEILRKVIYEMASPAIRKVSTLSGNIGNASPAADSLLALYALDAKVEIKSQKETRLSTVSELILGPRKTALKQNEIITEIIIPKSSFTQTCFVKVGGRRADAISKVAFVGCASVENNVIKDIRMTINAVAARLIRRQDIEKGLCEKTPDEVKQNVNAILEAYSTSIQPIDDQRSNKDYRKYTANNLIKAFLNTL